ncbi:MAG: tyrosine-type recombinase/integrase, partial [Desulfonatronovibrio sp.]
MGAVNFNQAFVTNIKCKKELNKERYYDNSCTGLILEVRPTGTKTYFIRYKDCCGKYKQMKLGRACDISVSEARQLGHRVLGDVAMGRDPLEEKRTSSLVPTMESFALEKYMPYVKGYKRSWKIDSDCLRLHILPVFGHKQMDYITQEEIQRFLRNKINSGLAPATVNRYLVIIKFMYNLALKWKVPGIKTNPASSIRKFEENNIQERYLTPEELKRLCAALKESENPLLEPIILMLILTGARKSEMLNSKWEDVDLQRKTIRFPLTKNGKSRTIPLSDKAVEILEGLKRVGPYVFTGPKTGEAFTSIYRPWFVARKKAGLEDVRLHTLRHSFASFLINGGRSIYEVGKLLGHSQISTTMRYAHLSDQTL